LWLHCKNTEGKKAFRGTAVAVTAYRALSALHGLSLKNSSFELVDIRGFGVQTEKPTSSCQVTVDIVLLELKAGETLFEAFIEIQREKSGCLSIASCCGVHIR